MKNCAILIVVFIISYSSAISVMGQTHSNLSLAECVRLAVENNPTLKQTELNVYRHQINYKQARYNRLPSLEGNINHGYNEGRSVNATTNQFVNTSFFSGGQSLYLSAPIFNGFQILHDIRRRASAQEAGKFEFEGAVNELKLDVIEAYVLVLTAQDMLRQTEGQLAVTQENVERMEIMHREGAADPGDFYDLKGQLRTDQNLLETNKQALYDRRLRLAALLNRAVDELPELEPLSFSIDQKRYSDAELYRTAMNVLPQFKALDWRITEAQQQINVMKSDYYPSLSLSASIQSRFSSIDDSGFNYWQQFRNYPAKGISLSLRIPIFSKMRVRTQVKLAKLDLDEVKWEREIQENALREQTAKAVFSMKTLRENVNNLREQAQSYQEAFRIAQVHFDAGNSNSVVFLTAKNKLDNTRNALVIKQYEWIMQKYINDYYAGTLDL
ncbi:TolC family protein [Sphingobacterium sp. DN00404]|uniref:TolC family protein n=1 Tax=Sphingobacterium micropteri TaxID=2763501 RepID=A0ABR7YSG8_9SPHI|nr:TolC family protein [Sphingobacterium micropteri]MBD1434166.1 TolC family protein [Sphingobacterium micropteri]